VANDPKKFRIPKEFTLFGSKYIVTIEDKLFETESCYGTADDDLKRIRLQKVGPATRISEEDGVKHEANIIVTDEVLIETFYHELCHIILDALGEEELSLNEKFVNMLGKSFLEVYLSSNYEEEKSQ
jgi:hypothetical protein